MKNFDIIKILIAMSILILTWLVLSPKLNPPAPTVTEVSTSLVPLKVQPYSDNQGLCYNFSSTPLFGSSLVSTDGLFMDKKYLQLTRNSEDYPLDSVVFSGIEANVDGKRCVIKVFANGFLISRSGTDKLECVNLNNPELQSGYSNCLSEDKKGSFYWLNWLIALAIGIPLLYIETKRTSIRDSLNSRNPKD